MKKLIYIIFSFYFANIFSGTHTVTNTNDSGPGSLRQAIINADADATSPRNIVFSIGSGVQVIQPLTVLPSLTTDNINIDGSTQPGYSTGNPVIVIDGTNATFGFDGLTIDGANNCTIQSLVINNGFNSAISIINGANGNAVYECFLGTNQTGTAASPNSIGLTMNATGANQNNNNIIGQIGLGNVISGNSGLFGAGMFLSGNLNNTVIVANKVGTDKTGTTAVPNSAVGIALISQPSSTVNVINNTRIGGPVSAQGNIISGNGPGIFSPVPGIFMGFQQVNNTIIQSNKIGVDITGQNALPNDIGIVTFTDIATTVDGTIIGGSNPAQSNVISANTFGGVLLQQAVNNSIIKGNYIGTNATGSAALGTQSNGLAISGDGNIIGGAPVEGNVISGNTGNGISFDHSNNIIKGNFIGVDKTGTISIPNGNVGIEVQGSTAFASDNNIIGGPGESNIISSNGQAGILFRTNMHNNVIQSNFIGTDQTGTINLANGNTGITIENFTLNFPSTNNLIGGTLAGQANVIKFNNNNGVVISGNPATPDILNPILTNSIFLNNSNGIALINDGNNLQEAPVVNSALLCPSNNVIIITATAPANPIASLFRLEFFVNSVDRTPITEGERFIGAIDSVPSGAVVTQSFTLPAPAIVLGQWVSATATNLNNTGDTPGDTSEFSANLQITAATGPTITLDADPSIICAGQSTTLTATFSGTGPFNLNWSDGVVQTNVASPVLRTVSPIVTTNYSVTVTDANGCQTVSNVENIIVNPLPTITLTTDKTNICIGSSATLNATFTGAGPFNLEWSDGFIQTGVTSPVDRIVSPTESTEYSVIVIDANGCQNTSNSILINVNSFPEITLSASALSICSGSSTTLIATFAGNSPLNLFWSDGLIQRNVSSPVERIVTPAQTTKYSVTVGSRGCRTQSNETTITVNNLPRIEISASPERILLGGTSTIIVRINGNGPFVLRWNDGLVQRSDTGIIRRKVSPIFSTSYSVTVIDENGCQATSDNVIIFSGKADALTRALIKKYGCNI